MAEYNFPTETIDLPSGGKLYPEGSPLRSGKVDVKYMTAKEEDILTSTNLIQKGTVIDKLMESLIVTPGVKPEDLISGDLNAVLVASRILAYGKEYAVKLPCTSCNKRFDYAVDLTTLDISNTEVEPVNGEYTVKLPTGVEVSFRLLTRKDEKVIEQEVEALKKIDNTMQGDTPVRLRQMITAVNGNRDKKTIWEFSEAMLVRDLRAFREEIKKVTPDINFDLNVTCTLCSAPLKVRMPFGANFFWPDFGV